jgi:superfamily II DNA or RNA helicase
MDGEDVFALFDQNVPYELRLRDAIVNGLVVPFKYYGIRDGKFRVAEPDFIEVLGYVTKVIHA